MKEGDSLWKAIYDLGDRLTKLENSLAIHIERDKRALVRVDELYKILAQG